MEAHLLPKADAAAPPADDGRPKAIRLFDRVTNGVFVAAMVTLLTVMTLLIGLDVILRVFFGAPIRGAHDLVGLSLLLLLVLGLPHSWRGEHHVRMDMVYLNLRPGAKLVVDLIGAVCAILFALLLAWQAYRYVPSLMRVGSSSVTLRIPYWPFAIAILCASLLFAVSIALTAIGSLLSRRRS